MTIRVPYDTMKTPEREYGRKGGDQTMTDKQMQFIAWLITTATDKCSTIDEVRQMNAEIRKHSAGLTAEPASENEDK